MTETLFERVMFFPWVGINYPKGGIFKKKILILGEAHYCDDPKVCPDCIPGNRNGCNGMTIQVIEEQISGNGKQHPIFTKLAKLLLDKEVLDGDDKSRFWNSVAFYNYVQTSVAAKARVAPTQQMYSISEEPFEEVMDKLEPDFLLIVSSRLWENLPGQAGVDWPAGPIINENNITERTWYYKGKRKKTLSLVIYHPSSRQFSYEYKPIVKKWLSL